MLHMQNYILLVTDEFHTPIIEVPIPKAQAAEVLMNAITSGALTVDTRKVQREEPEENKTRGKNKGNGKRKCGNCGGTGHTARTCNRPAGSAVSKATLEDENEELPQNSQLQKIRELLKDGKSDDEVAIDTGAPIRTIKYIRRQMIGRKELQE